MQVADESRDDVPTKLHMETPTARALLGPMRLELLAIERRAQRLIDVLKLPEADQAAIRAAHESLVAARRQVERLYEGSERR